MNRAIYIFKASRRPYVALCWQGHPYFIKPCKTSQKITEDSFLELSPIRSQLLSLKNQENVLTAPIQVFNNLPALTNPRYDAGKAAGFDNASLPGTATSPAHEEPCRRAKHWLQTQHGYFRQDGWKNGCTDNTYHLRTEKLKKKKKASLSCTQGSASGLLRKVIQT